MTLPPPLRFLCPRCRSSIDLCAVEAGSNGVWQFAVCPECDEVIVLGEQTQPVETALPGDEALGSISATPCELLSENEVTHV